MRLEQVHQTIEAARDQRARYLWDAVYGGIARVLGQTLKRRRERPAAPRRRLATGEPPVQRRKARPKLAVSE
jgi:hypothetical protein